MKCFSFLYTLLEITHQVQNTGFYLLSLSHWHIIKKNSTALFHQAIFSLTIYGIKACYQVLSFCSQNTNANKVNELYSLVLRFMLLSSLPLQHDVSLTRSTCFESPFYIKQVSNKTQCYPWSLWSSMCIHHKNYPPCL